MHHKRSSYTCERPGTPAQSRRVTRRSNGRLARRPLFRIHGCSITTRRANAACSWEHQLGGWSFRGQTAPLHQRAAGPPAVVAAQQQCCGCILGAAVVKPLACVPRDAAPGPCLQGARVGGCSGARAPWRAQSRTGEMSGWSSAATFCCCPFPSPHAVDPLYIKISSGKPA